MLVQQVFKSTCNTMFLLNTNNIAQKEKKMKNYTIK